MGTYGGRTGRWFFGLRAHYERIAKLARELSKGLAYALHHQAPRLMATLATARPAPALPLLFARYVAGQIAQAQWDAFADAFDEADASADERAAFAHFYLEASSTDEEIKLPRAGEVEDLLAAVQI